MKLDEIFAMPTLIREIPATRSGAHESLTRSYHTLAKVQEWLQLGCPSAIVLELIDTAKYAPEPEAK